MTMCFAVMDGPFRPAVRQLLHRPVPDVKRQPLSDSVPGLTWRRSACALLWHDAPTMAAVRRMCLTAKGTELAVIVDFDVQGATADELYEVERLTVARGEAAALRRTAGACSLR